jgi:hypothetical protein
MTGIGKPIVVRDAALALPTLGLGCSGCGRSQAMLELTLPVTLQPFVSARVSHPPNAFNIRHAGDSAAIAENDGMDHEFDHLYTAATSLQNLMVAIAQGGQEGEADYVRLRQALIGDPRIEPLLPIFVKTCRTKLQFWGYIQPTSKTYKGRRENIYGAFQRLLDFLEKSVSAPADKNITGVLEKFDAAYVNAAWAKALERRTTDPEGAITSARTLLESVCKHILDEEQVSYDDKDDIPKLYRKTAEKLNIAPSQHTEEVFKMILGGCTAVVEGLGTLRNRLSDAHGKGKIAAKPQPRHAELAVNLSGALTQFVLSTWDARNDK